MRKILFIFFIVLVSANYSIYGQVDSRESSVFQKNYEASKLMLESRNYQFEAEWIYSPKQKKRESLSDNSGELRVQNTGITINLQKSISDTSIIRLSGKVLDYKVDTVDEKQQVIANFKTTGSTGIISFKLVSTANGKATLYLQSNQNGEVAYIGTIKEL